MVIKYCSVCQGKPYTRDLQMDICPECMSNLNIELVDEYELESRPVLSSCNQQGEDNNDALPVDDYTDTSNVPDVKRNGGVPVVDDGGSQGFVHPRERDENDRPQNVIRGKVYRYSSSGGEDGSYRRYLPVRIFQALVYRQRLEDVIHRFSVHVEFPSDSMGYDNSIDIPVNAHGTIAGGLQLTDGDEVEVHGKYLNENFMAERIYIMNNGYRTQVRFQRSVRTIVCGIVLAVLMIAALSASGTIGDDFFTNLGTFFVGWAASFLLVTIIYFILGITKIGIFVRAVSREKPKFPFFVILVISAILSLLFLYLPVLF